MSNLTISVDEEVLKRARMRALEQGSSVNAVLRELLEAYAGVNEAQSAAARDLGVLSRETKPASGSRTWTRDQLHERR